MKRSITLSLLLVLTMASCGGNSLVDDGLNTNTSQEGTVQVMALQHLRDGGEGEITAEDTKVFESDLGYTITLNHALIHFHQMQLISSGDDPTCVGGNDQAVTLHSTHDLMGADLLSSVLGSTTVPYVFYCSWELMIGTDDSHGHAQKLSEMEYDHESITDAFQLKGTWSKDGKEGDFELIGMDPIMISANFKTKENGEVIEHPLHIHEGESELSVLIGTKYDLLLDGIHFEGPGVLSLEDQLNQVYENLKTAVHQHTGDHHSSTDGHTHSDDTHNH